MRHNNRKPSVTSAIRVAQEIVRLDTTPSLMRSYYERYEVYYPDDNCHTEQKREGFNNIDDAIEFCCKKRAQEACRHLGIQIDLDAVPTSGRLRKRVEAMASKHGIGTYGRQTNV